MRRRRLLVVCWSIGWMCVAPAHALTVTFAGDYDATDQTHKVLHRIGAIKPEAHFAIGDLSYGRISEARWCAMVNKQVSQPFLLVPGNHESDGEDGDIKEFSACLPYRYRGPLSGTYPNQYVVDMPAEQPVARFIMISPNLSFSDGAHYEYREGTPSMAWLRAAVSEGRRRGIPWIVVGMHKVCITTETKSCEVGEALLNALIDAKVDVVLQGHVHAYERSFPWRCARALSFAPECLASSEKHDYRRGGGTIFITAGTGGVPLRALNADDVERPYFVSLFGKGTNEHYGVVALHIDKHSLRQAFIDATTGQTLDHFSLRAR